MDKFKQILGNIKASCIHALKGKTNNEHSLSEFNFGKDAGSQQAYNEVLNFAKSINGVSADDWCKMVYEFVESRTTDVDEETNYIIWPSDVTKLDEIIRDSEHHCYLDIEQREFLKKLRNKLETLSR